jgi:protease IV
LKSIASGRVWSGLEAKANGLVDAIGGVDDAVKLAAQKANLKDTDYRVKYYPAQKDFFTRFFDQKSEDAEAKILATQFGVLAPYVLKVQKLQSQQGIMAKMPFDMEIK